MFSKKKLESSLLHSLRQESRSYRKKTQLEEWRSELFSWVCVCQAVQSRRIYLPSLGLHFSTQKILQLRMHGYLGWRPRPPLVAGGASFDESRGWQMFHFHHQRRAAEWKAQVACMSTHDCHKREAVSYCL